MKLGRALLACDSNPDYLKFWKLAHDSWTEIIGIKCTLILVAHEIPEWLPYKEDVVLFKPIEGIHTAFQAQCIRLLWPCLIDSDEAIIPSDIDMMALCKSYFVDTIDGAPDESFIVYRRLQHRCKSIWMCYVAAAPSTWAEIYDCHSEDDVRRILVSWHEKEGYDGVHGGRGWFTDQLMLYEYVYKRWNKRLIVFNDRDLGFQHLDKINTNWLSLTDELKGELLAGVYHDFCLPPFDYFEKQITDIYDFLVENKPKDDI
jgi:hypothetical protein